MAIQINAADFAENWKQWKNHAPDVSGHNGNEPLDIPLIMDRLLLTNDNTVLTPGAHIMRDITVQ